MTGLKGFLERINLGILIIFFIALFYTAGLFIAPMTLEPGTVTGLDGNANMIDYREKWDELGPYHNMIYTFSDFNCHQRHYRSYSVGGNQMPVCARDVGIFIGMSAGLLLMTFVTPRMDYKDTILSLVGIDQDISKRKKYLILGFLACISVLPMALDGGIQLVTSYESVNPLRTITGLLFGFGFSVFISSLLISTVEEARVDMEQSKRTERS